jgi:bifunctional DNA-binding transcriptional regulator/antitoxin component of YhaV-PrlF toxin-antitoxin module
LGAYKHFTLEDRKLIEKMLKAGSRAQSIADSVGVHYSSLYREIKRGETDDGYNAEYADAQYRNKLQDKGATPILIADSDLADFISKCLLEKCLSPRQTIALIESGETPFSPDSAPSVQTIYSAVENGYIPNVTKEKLSMHRKATMFSDGHIIIPKKIRSLLSFEDGDVFEIEINEETQEIVIKKRSLISIIPIAKRASVRGDEGRETRAVYLPTLSKPNRIFAHFHSQNLSAFLPRKTYVGTHPTPVFPASHASRYNTLHLASKVVCQRWTAPPLESPCKT